MNDLVQIDNLVYLLKYDTVYGKYEKKVTSDDNNLIIEGKGYRVFSEKDPAQLPWDELRVDIVFDDNEWGYTNQMIREAVKLATG